MNYLKALHIVEESMRKIGEPLTDNQKAVLAGNLAVICQPNAPTFEQEAARSTRTAPAVPTPYTLNPMLRLDEPAAAEDGSCAEEGHTAPCPECFNYGRIFADCPVCGGSGMVRDL